MNDLLFGMRKRVTKAYLDEPLKDLAANLDLAAMSSKSVRRPESTGLSYAAFLQNVIDASGSGIVVLDDRRTIVTANKPWAEFIALAGFSGEDPGVGVKYPDIFRKLATSGKEYRKIVKELNRIITHEITEFQTVFQCDQTSYPAWFLIHAAAIHLPRPDDRVAIIVTHEPLSLTRIASNAPESIEGFLKGLFGTTTIVPWEASDARRGQFTYLGSHAHKFLGYAVTQWNEPNFWASHIHPDDRRRVTADFLKSSAASGQVWAEYRMIAKDGHIVWVHDSVEGGSSNGPARGLMIDVTDRKNAEHSLKYLGGRLIRAQEEERKRIARELHDDISQRVALISIELEQLSTALNGKTPEVGAKVREIQKNVDEIGTEIHEISYQLHPSKLDHLGLAAALRSYCSEVAAARGLKVSFVDESSRKALTRDIELCFFRVGQEALQNATRHSGASIVNVFLSVHSESITLIISDNGCGFDVSSDTLSEGLGLISMEERLRLVGGKLKIISKKSKGTRVEATTHL